MRKIFSNEKLRFFTKVTLAHVITYTIVTIMAIPLTMDYAENVVELMGFRP
jgi:hypothetical protein